MVVLGNRMFKTLISSPRWVRGAKYMNGGMTWLILEDMYWMVLCMCKKMGDSGRAASRKLRAVNFKMCNTEVSFFLLI